MLKRYLMLASALCFMTVGVSRCPFPFSSVKSSRPQLQAQAPANQVATPASTTHL
jgi:hypothetical protein